MWKDPSRPALGMAETIKNGRKVFGPFLCFSLLAVAISLLVGELLHILKYQ